MTVVSPIYNANGMRLSGGNGDTVLLEVDCKNQAGDPIIIGFRFHREKLMSSLQRLTDHLDQGPHMDRV